jgi:hypothetical protein
MLRFASLGQPATVLVKHSSKRLSDIFVNRTQNVIGFAPICG